MNPTEGRGFSKEHINTSNQSTYRNKRGEGGNPWSLRNIAAGKKKYPESCERGRKID